MRWNCSRFLLLIFMGTLIPDSSLVDVYLFAETPARAPRPLTDDDVTRLIADLHSVKFQTRQEATRKLADARSAAVPALREAALGGIPEVAMRAVQILGEIHKCQQGETIDRVETVLYEVKDQGSPMIAQLSERVLDINYLIVQNRAAEKIRELGGVVNYYSGQTIQLRNPGFTPPNLHSMKKQVETIMLSDGWKGGTEGLKYVRRMKKLPVIFIIESSGISPEASAKLQADMPQLRVQLRGRAFLGVRMQPDPLGRGCVIIDVTEGSAAEKAGLKPQDIIATFDGNPTPDPDTLIDLIGNYQPGKKVSVDMLRLGQKSTIPVVLGVWK